MRAKEVIKDYVLELIDQSEPVQYLENVRRVIEKDRALTPVLSDVVRDILTNKANEEIENLYPPQLASNILSDIDELSILSDAWGIYVVNRNMKELS